MSEFEIILDLVGKIKQQLENLKATEKISEYLLDFLKFEREQQSMVFKVRLDFWISVKRERSEQK